MNDCRLLATGLFLLAVGGCAAQPKPVTTTSILTKTDSTAINRPVQTDANGNPSPSPDSAAGMLIDKVSQYANANGELDTPNPPVIPPVDSNRSGGRKNRGSNSNGPADTGNSGNTDISSPIGTSVSSGPAARQAGARLSPQAPLFNGAPRIVSESEDFTSTGSGSDALSQRLTKRARENPRDLSNQLDLMLYGMLNDDQSPDLGSLSTIQPEDRELLSTLVDGLSNFRSTVREDVNMLPAGKMRPLQDMVERLRSQADLNVPVAVLCKKVDAYGKYDPITPLRFPASHENQVIVYCEVENFLAKQNGRQMWETRLCEQVVLYTDSGLLVWSDDRQSVTDECRNRRHDFFCFNKITLPANLTVGRYVLKVSIEDENTDPYHVAEASVPISITAQ